jgi:hypothetical protein
LSRHLVVCTMASCASCLAVYHIVVHCLHATLLSAAVSSTICIAALLFTSTSTLPSALLSAAPLSALLSAASSSALLLSVPSMSVLLGWGGDSALSYVFVGGGDGVIFPQHGR